MSQSRREQATIHIRHLRQELKELYIALNEDGLLPEKGEIKALLSQLEALHEISLGIKKKKIVKVKTNPKINIEIIVATKGPKPLAIG